MKNDLTVNIIIQNRLVAINPKGLIICVQNMQFVYDVFTKVWETGASRSPGIADKLWLHRCWGAQVLL